MANIILFFYITLAFGAHCIVSAEYDQFDTYIDIPFKPIKTSAQRIKDHGYPAESHFVETSDGYVLNIFRIPYSPKLNNAKEKRPVVLIQHGLFSCSDCFLLNGPDNALAYNFADAGFDVWLGNARGNIYSRNNTKISLKHPYFWEFSWHEIGAFDMPAMIDYILAETNEFQLHYVGHSQGTTVFFVMASHVPEYNAKIKTAHMLAPSVYMGNSTNGLIINLAPYMGHRGAITSLMENQVFLPENPIVQRVLDTACGGESLLPEYCKTLFLLWAGQDQGNLNMTLLPGLAETHPAGISANQAIHYIQSYTSNDFRRYDYGRTKNLKYYKQEIPPSYDLSKINAAMYLYIGLSDTSATVRDCERLRQILPNIKLYNVLDDASWTHLDFLFANQVKKVINEPVIEACLDYESDKINLKN